MRGAFWALRPQTGYYADSIEGVAALWESLGQNRPFLDRNKRTAFAAAYTFLAINGLKMTADTGPTYELISGLNEAGEFSFEQLVTWLWGNTEEGGSR